MKKYSYSVKPPADCNSWFVFMSAPTQWRKWSFSIKKKTCWSKIQLYPKKLLNQNSELTGNGIIRIYSLGTVRMFDRIVTGMVAQLGLGESQRIHKAWKFKKLLNQTCRFCSLVVMKMKGLFWGQVKASNEPLSLFLDDICMRRCSSTTKDRVRNKDN